MQNILNKLTQAELSQVMQALSEQMNTGEQSSNVDQVVIQKRDGSYKMLLDIRQEVILDKNNVPKVMKVNRLQTLDCGHSYKPGDQYIECDNGHVLCFRHELFTCSKCGKRICELDLDFKDGKPICKEHNEWSIFKTIMVCVFIILGIAFLIWLKNECGC